MTLYLSGLFPQNPLLQCNHKGKNQTNINQGKSLLKTVNVIKNNVSEIATAKSIF
jgi:hypothetical protein